MSILNRLFGPRKRPHEKEEAEAALRAELFGPGQLETHLRALAVEHAVDVRPGPERLLDRLDANEQIIIRSYETIAEAIRQGRQVAPAAEWLLDNYYLIEEQVRITRQHLPADYSRQLPRLTAGELKGFPRVYSLTMELVSHTDGRINAQVVTQFVRAYQGVAPLRLGELWAVPIMLRLTLIENLRRVAYRIAWRRQHRDLALEWTQRFERAQRQGGRDLITTLADLVRSDPPTSAPFIAELAGGLQAISFNLAINWLEDELARRGQTLEAIQQAESQDQAADQVSIGNSITSLRALGAIDWRNFVESLSVTEAVLRRDPCGVYARCDFATRDDYRHIIEHLARRSGWEEEQVAERAVRLANDRLSQGHGDRQCHVGYYLYVPGRLELEREIGYRPTLRRRLARIGGRRPFQVYVNFLVLALLMLAGPLLLASQVLIDTHGWAAFVILSGAVLLAASEPAFTLVNWLCTLLVPPYRMARLDLAKGLEEEQTTAIVVPTLISGPQDARELADQMEIRYLANRSENLLLVLLTDFGDADHQHLPQDAPALQAAVEAVEEMNRRYGHGGDKFFLLHRDREYNPAESKWMGHERKRGKLEQFNRLVLENRGRYPISAGQPAGEQPSTPEEGPKHAAPSRGNRVASPFSTVVGDVSALGRVRYVIALDSDTQLPPESVWKMVGCIAHPVNRPELDERTACVRQGYGILQPRLAVSLLAAQQTRYTRLMAGEVGLDPYSRQVSNVYHDVIGQAQFAGKGVYDVEAFAASLDGRFPDNRILSHDLIEGCYARCGFVNDVELLEDHPPTVTADLARRHRWVRGDWQIARWTARHVPTAKDPSSRNPLSAHCRWMVFDNLRRSLVPWGWLAALIGGWLLPGPLAGAWTLTLLLLYFLPNLAQTAYGTILRDPQVSWSTHLNRAGVTHARAWLMDLLQFVLLPVTAYVYLDAIVRVCWRLKVSHRRLLEWRTSAETNMADSRNSLVETARRMWPGPVAAALAAWTVWGLGTGAAAAYAVCGLWLAAAPAAWALGWTCRKRVVTLGAQEEAFLRRLARRTWAFFDELVTPEHHGLPPDNFQEQPRAAVAERTSPTNMAMGLLCNLAAHDFGYVTTGRLASRLEQTLSTMEGLERYKGHFYNWYGTKDLRPLHPLYVSTVDSSNLAGNLVTLRSGLLEAPREPILPASWRAGLLDTLAILLEELDSLSVATPAVKRLREAAAERARAIEVTPDTLTAARAALVELAGAIVRHAKATAGHEEVDFWLEALKRQGDDLLGELDHLAPWLADEALARSAEDQPAFAERLGLQSALAHLGAGMTLEELARVHERIAPLLPQAPEESRSANPQSGPLAPAPRTAVRNSPAGPAGPQPSQGPLMRRLLAHVATAQERATARIHLLRELAQRCQEMSEFDVQFLYDSDCKLLTIGYNVESHRRDTANYDLLASESRLGSFLGVARGQLPVEHWFSLGRQLAPGGRAPVLVSWSGSMFEYLMPLLIMPTFDSTLLDLAQRGAVRRQIRYGRTQRVPWGVSESCYNQIDSHMIYQYRAFGVPSLGLKRGLADDMVVAPYASAMALMVDPQAACDNLQAMARLKFVGRLGLYEAVDYTPGRVPHDENHVVVRTYMAHHSGMTLLSILYVLGDQIMQKRFLANPELRANVLLLQERVPVVRASSALASSLARAPMQLRLQETRELSVRFLTLSDLGQPEVHLLSNGHYHVMVTQSGSSYSRLNNLALTRWREDACIDDQGLFIFVRDVSPTAPPTRAWATTYQPSGGLAPAAGTSLPALDRYEVTYSQGKAEYLVQRDRLEVRTEVAVSNEDDVEVRRVQITNLSSRSRMLEVTTFVDAVLQDQLAELSHPAFCGLFLQTELLRDKGAVLITRRPRSTHESWPCLFHSMTLADAEGIESTSFETDRARFLGRCRNVGEAAALEKQGSLSNSAGDVLGAVAAVRRRVRIAAAQTLTLTVVLGAAPTREQAPVLVDKYASPGIADRVFELAWTRSQVMFHQLRMDEADAQLFGRLAGAVLFCNARHRGKPSQIARNRKGQSALWSYGISGDLPIVLLRISSPGALELVRQAMRAHAYWRHKGLRSDLVIWCEAFSGYRQSLLDAVIGAAQSSGEGKSLDQSGGIFIRDVVQIPEDDRLMFQAVARLILSDRAGSLGEQAERGVVQAEPAGEEPAPAPVAPEEMELPPRELRMFNSLGGFTSDGREYVTVLRPGTVTPAPWANVLANPHLGSVVSESDSTYTWFHNAHEFRLSEWHNDPVRDPTSEAFYIRDEETRRFWSPMPAPRRGPTPYVCRHGLGYSVFEHTQEGLFTETTVFACTDAPVKVVLLKLRNVSDRHRRFSVTGYCQWVLGELRSRNAMHVVSQLDPQTGALFASNAFNTDAPGWTAFFQCSERDRNLTADRMEFIGPSGSLVSPAGMRRPALSNRVGAALDPCAAIRAYVDVPPGQERWVSFVLGAGDNEQHARSLVRSLQTLDSAVQELREVWEFWKRQLGGVYVQTPDESLNFLANHWLLYQVLVSRYWGRSGFYQSGGAYGFRDQLQDSLAFLWECPWLTREHLLRAGSRQFPEGDVQGWWHVPSGRGVRTRISDVHLWLPYVASRYVQTTRDTGVLDEKLAFIEGRPLADGEDHYYDRPQNSDKQATLYEHCARAVRHALRFGRHALPLMGCGDWNDGMNHVGAGGRGESVWLAFFLLEVLRQFEPLARDRGDEQMADLCRTQGQDLRNAIEAAAWDGQWYLRAFFDDGSPLGSHRNDECRIDSISQSWAVLSQGGSEHRLEQAMESLWQKLVDTRHGLVRLFAPPFVRSPGLRGSPDGASQGTAQTPDAAANDVGYIQGYIPGVRENGGQYTHAAVWAAMAFARRGQAQRAWTLWDMLCPVRHADSPERVAAYKAEPFVVAADVYTAAGHEGRGGWTWYTGSAAWMYQFVLGSLLGLRVEGDRLSFQPLPHPDWTEYAVHYRYRNTYYHVRVLHAEDPQKPDRASALVRRVLLDEAEQDDHAVHMIDDGHDHHVVVEIA